MKILVHIFLLLFCQAVIGQNISVEATRSNVAYGNEQAQVFDFFQATSTAPTPLLFFIHGGAWKGGDKKDIHQKKFFPDLSPFLDNGISVITVNYRLLKDVDNTIYPKVSIPINDILKALHYVIDHDTEFYIDKNNIALCGGSAGACSSLIIGLNSSVSHEKKYKQLRKSINAVFAIRAQTSLDPKMVKQWIQNNKYGAHAFNLELDPKNKKVNYKNFLNKRDEILKEVHEYSPYDLLKKGKRYPALYLYYPSSIQLENPKIKDPVHSANYGYYFNEKCRELNIPCQLYTAENGYDESIVMKDIIKVLVKKHKTF
ncbi:alpha/beta hydrolase [Flammeovirga agarivorans]|uniref:Alpha/beta hydrolase n=1 Tax=Flammeovirga agarivorans TaxID=2726742 RepID=A0A7X8SNI1_9BACT|nr:alpha/beta hydrolase [Flammeovirga agarivorans]NLR93461.1 alpha/beta hydrolase [Flammeovirga agarivorans]